MANTLLEIYNEATTLGLGKEILIYPGAGKKLPLGRCSYSPDPVLKQDSGQRLQGGKNIDTGDF